MSKLYRLPSHFLLQKPFSEHHFYHEGGEYIEEGVICYPNSIYFKSDYQKCCVSFNSNRKISTNYYVGTDWLNKGVAVFVEPKLNEGAKQTDYLKMFFAALKHSEIAKHTYELFEIKWDVTQIEITQQQDLLTPFLVVQFLQVVQEIVRKGLKKSYYRVEQNLYSKVKGKILVGQTIKHNHLKNKPLNTFCTFDEFGVNGLENRLLKKALVFVRRYLPTLKIPHSEKYTTEVLNYIMPAFEFVSEEVTLNDIKHGKTNVFYKEYQEGIRLAKLILKRFGYNITNTHQEGMIKTPPFWIDMSKLFELYVLGLLKDRFKNNEVTYLFKTNYQELDFLIKSEDHKMVVDAKYKTIYQKHYEKEDVRQISGYARMKSVYRKLEKKENEIIDCLIIYPDQANGNEDFKSTDFSENVISEFVQFYKVSIKLPTIKNPE